VGHLIVASEACAGLGLDRMIFIPSARPPHKRSTVQATAEQRLRMVLAAVDGDPRFEVDDLELRRGGASYTVDTLRELQRRCPRCELFFLIGADALRDLPTWREPDEVMRLARLVTFERGGEATGEVEGVLRIPVTRVDISASEIRRRVHEGEPIRYLVPDPVREIIEGEGLYK
jgi:nicotinate-nucleotide adenylyltransferase